MIYGYVRVSTKEQNSERQIRNILREYSEAKIFVDEYSGRTLNRPSFNKLLKIIREGDIIVFDSVSRMSRNEIEGFELYQELFKKGIELVFIKEHHIDTSVYKNALDNSITMTNTSVDFILEGINKYLLDLAKEQIRLAFAQSQKEVDDLRQRTREGMETARRLGKQIGGVRGSKYNVKKSKIVKDGIMKYSKDFNGNLTDIDVMKILNVQRNTYYKYKRELKNE